ncbi:MAG: hypothetical protein COA42_12440, partial [Alteromonadaceae bacterium]
VNVEEKESAKEYSAAAQSIVASFGGKPIGKYATVAAIAGSNSPSITLMIEFESAEKFKACFESADYKAIIPLRDKGFSEMDIYMAE